MTQAAAIFQLFLVALAWGATFPVMKFALEQMGPMQLLAIRFALAGGLLSLIFWRRLQGLTRTELKIGLAIGVTLGLGYIVQTIGLEQTTSGKAGFITGLNIPLVSVLSFFFFRERISLRAAFGVTLALIGLGLLSLTADLTFAKGDLWVLGCAFLYAMQVTLVARYAKEFDPIRLAIVQIMMTAALSTFGALILESVRLDFEPVAWIWIVIAAVFATAMALVFQFRGQAHTTPTVAAIILGLESPLAAFFGWLFADEVMSSRQVFGAILILLGMLAVTLPEKRLKAG